MNITTAKGLFTAEPTYFVQRYDQSWLGSKISQFKKNVRYNRVVLRAILLWPFYSSATFTNMDNIDPSMDK